MTTIAITVFTDPTCPYAYSAEPIRLRLQWLYGDQLKWRHRMIVLSGYDGETSSLTTMQVASFKKSIREQYGMPIVSDELPRLPQSELACRAFVATNIHQPASADALLRELRIAAMSNKLVDEQSVIDDCAASVGIAATELTDWMKDARTTRDLTQDAEAARMVSPVARQAFKRKLSTTSSDRTRYSAPSYVFEAENGTPELPGFWPLEAYEAVLANLEPELKRGDDPASVKEVLLGANTPLATAEVAMICNKSIDEVRDELESIATLVPVAQDGFWALR